MLSLGPASPNLTFPPVISPDFASSKFRSFLFFPSRRPGRRRPDSLMGVGGIRRARNGCEIFRVLGLLRRCKRELDGEGDSSLEDEILEFMKSSENPNLFPAKKQLLDAGRADLVDEILRRGGWLSLGWDLDCEDESEYFPYDIDFGEEFGDGLDRVVGSSNQHSGSFELETRDDGRPSFDSSRSGVSLESQAESNSGIEGILSRLEKERNITFGVGLRDKGGNDLISMDDIQNSGYQGMPTDESVAGFDGRINSTSLISHKGIINGSRASITRTGTFADVGGLGNTTQPLMWRMWSTRRAGFSENDFEAAEIDPLRDRVEAGMDFLKNDVVETREESIEQVEITKVSSSSHNVISHDQIKSRLHHLEAELSSVLQLLRSKSLRDEEKNPATVSEDLRELSDSWEFQENEVMHAQDRLRSIRAKLAVLEGKMALAIIDAQKLVEEKQKRIEETHRALRLLRTACVVWSNPATEVLLSGSFDGWTTQRRMEKSSTGIFSLSLKLYPGRYEIKFIVDGIWRIDPLRPIVNNNGYENNLLIIT